MSKGTTWSIVLYSITAAAASREQHWREASQAFYRVSMVYSNMQATANAGTTPTHHVFVILKALTDTAKFRATVSICVAAGCNTSHDTQQRSYVDTITRLLIASVFT